MTDQEFCIEQTYRQLSETCDVLDELKATLEYMTDELATSINCGGSIHWTQGHAEHLNRWLGEWSLNLPAVRAAAVNLRKIDSEAK